MATEFSFTTPLGEPQPLELTVRTGPRKTTWELSYGDCSDLSAVSLMFREIADALESREPAPAHRKWADVKRELEAKYMDAFDARDPDGLDEAEAGLRQLEAKAKAVTLSTDGRKGPGALWDVDDADDIPEYFPKEPGGD